MNIVLRLAFLFHAIINPLFYVSLSYMAAGSKQIINNQSISISEAVKQQFYPSLNGLRGIAVLLVLMFHLTLSWNTAYTTIFNGPLGVNIFFVLSGFLITSLCLKERLLTGTISLKDFYLRRILRILPVAYLYILVIFILDCIFHLHIPWFQYLGVLFFVANFSYFRSHQYQGIIGHYWSLSIEEQFYIIFPVVLKLGNTFYFWSMIFLVAMLPVICSVQEVSVTLNQGALYFFTHFFIKFQSIAVGCLFSLLAFRKAFDYKWLSAYKVIGNIIAIFFIFYLKYDVFYTIKTVWINLIIALLIGYVIISNIAPANDFIYKFLNTGFLSFTGLLSYSLYIWQPLFTWGDPRLSKFMLTFPVNLAGVIIVSCLSYFFYERYFIKLKQKFSRLKKAGAV